MGRKEGVPVPAGTALTSQAGPSGTFRGGPGLGAPAPPPAVPGRPARGRPGSGGGRPLRLRPGRGPGRAGRAGAPGPRRRSQAVQTLTHCCPGRAPGPARLQPSRGRLCRRAGSGGGWQAAPREAGGRGPGPLPSSADPPRSRRGSAGRGRRSQPGSYRWRRGRAASPAAPGAREGRGGRAVGGGARAAGGGHVGPRAGRGPGARGELGPTCNESEITLFNYTFPGPPSAIGAF